MTASDVGQESKVEYRVSYMMNGSSQHSGVFYTEVKARDALRSFKLSGRAWLQVRRGISDSWKTID